MLSKNIKRRKLVVPDNPISVIANKDFQCNEDNDRFFIQSCTEGLFFFQSKAQPALCFSPTQSKVKDVTS